MKIAVKNMYCPRCLKAVREILLSMGLTVQHVDLGEAYVSEELTEEQLSHLGRLLEAEGFELLQDQKAQQIEAVRNAILDLIYGQEVVPQVNLSDYVEKKVGVSYKALSALFSSTQGQTIERYFIRQKIERIKELITYEELTLSEISFMLGYSSVAHLSTQFKRETGLSPSYYRHRRTPRRGVDSIKLLNLFPNCVTALSRNHGIFAIAKNKNTMKYLDPFVSLLVEMAPYLLLGFFVAGLLHVFVPNGFYRRYLAGNDFRSVGFAALLGIPLPLCSCGVIPTAMSMRREGASRASTVSFLIATPQTGVDSILATAALLGVPFAVMRPLAALATALLGGMLLVFLNRGEAVASVPVSGASCVSRPKASFGAKCVEALRYGFVDMMQDIGRWLLIGLLLAGLITILVPEDFFARLQSVPMLNMLLVLLISIPMYFCATGSIPVAAALMLKGLSPGAALVLLMAGPAANLASITVIGKVLGKKSMVAYLVSLIVGAFTFGLLIDYVLPTEWFSSAMVAGGHCGHGCEEGYAWWKVASAAVLAVLIVVALVLKRTGRKSSGCGCGSGARRAAAQRGGGRGCHSHAGHGQTGCHCGGGAQHAEAQSIDGCCHSHAGHGQAGCN